MAKQQDQQKSGLPKIGAPATRALTLAGYTRLSQLTKVSEAELLKLHGVGPKAIRILRQTLAETGASFAGESTSPKRAAQVRKPTAIHPLVLQLRFTRREFLRSVIGVSEDDARQRLLPMNCLSWNVGHLAWQEQSDPKAWGCPATLVECAKAGRRP
jgi:hypothetical protein